MDLHNIIGSRYIRISSDTLEDIQNPNSIEVKLPSTLNVKRQDIIKYNERTQRDEVVNIKIFEVALVQMRCVKSWHNISSRNNNNTFKYSIDNGTTWHTIIFENGHYELDDINSYLRQVFRENNHWNPDAESSQDVYPIQFIPNYATLKTTMKVIDKINENPINVVVDFTTSNFSQLLGFDKDIYQGEDYYTSQNKAKLDSIDEILVRCNIVGGSSSNNDQSDIIYSFVPVAPAGGIFSIEIFNPIYLPIKVDRIDSIRMRLTDQFGNLIDFNGEDVSYTLHIRSRVE